VSLSHFFCILYGFGSFCGDYQLSSEDVLAKVSR